MSDSSIFNKKLLYSLLSLLLLSACGQEKAEDNPLPKDTKIAVSHCCSPNFAFVEEVLTGFKEESKKSELNLDIKVANEQQTKQLRQVRELLKDNPDVLLLANQYGNIPPKKHQKIIFDMAKTRNIPVILYVIGARPIYHNNYDNLYYVGFIPAWPAIAQGEAIINDWKQHPKWDLNGDGIIQYAILKGVEGNPYSEDRTKWVQSTIKNYPKANIKAESVAVDIADFDRKKATQVVKKWHENGTLDKAEVIIANSDGMVLGAVDAFKSLKIKRPLYGVDGLPEVLQAIKKGNMTGTVMQNPKDIAKETLNLASNLIAKRPLTTGTELKVVDRKLELPAIFVNADNVDEFISGKK
ncbi:MAG: substrate-binding domain-containing protein [Moraxellaceae bacterium]|nr:substrate-binding domain-containing protein [Moraxellaceae bacterium]